MWKDLQINLSNLAVYNFPILGKTVDIISMLQGDKCFPLLKTPKANKLMHAEPNRPSGGLGPVITGLAAKKRMQTKLNVVWCGYLQRTIMQ